MKFGTLVGSACMIAALTLPSSVNSAEVRLIVAAPMKGVVEDLGARFERETGNKIVARFVSGPIVKREIDGGAMFDTAISITPVIDELAKEGKLRAATRKDVGYAVIGVGVRAGAPKPDIRTVEAFKNAFLRASSVAHSATGASGDHFRNIIKSLGIEEEMKPKLRPMAADTIAQAVPSGQAELIVVTASVIMVPGADYVGPLPVELQFYNRFAAGVGSDASQIDAASKFVSLLTDPSVAPVYKAHGMEMGVPR
jgi:molybdate transport system substrate-binding protein